MLIQIEKEFKKFESQKMEVTKLKHGELETPGNYKTNFERYMDTKRLGWFEDGKCEIKFISPFFRDKPFLAYLILIFHNTACHTISHAQPLNKHSMQLLYKNCFFLCKHAGQLRHYHLIKL